ncbi:hypothetical protein G6K93_07885 [Agrobacterium rhizogenes]|nr:hypothetical protein [Rhizobium rhizogenes]
MAEISDVTKLRPDLQELSDNELQRRMDEFQMEVDRRQAEKDRQAKAAEAAIKNAIIDNYLNSLREMESHQLLPAEVLAVYTNAGGNFTPHLKHKKIKA